MNQNFVASMNVANANLIISDLRANALVRPLTAEEITIGRRAAHVLGEHRKNEALASAAKLRETELKAMKKLGYSDEEANEELRIAAFNRREAAGFGHSRRCRFVWLNNN